MHQTKIDAFRVFEDKADWDEKNKKERRSEQTNECSSPRVSQSILSDSSLSLSLSPRELHECVFYRELREEDNFYQISVLFGFG